MTNREIIERQMDAANRAAFDELEQFGADDVVLDLSRSMGPGRGVYRGFDGVRRFLESLLESFASVVAIPRSMHECGDWTAVEVTVRTRGRESGVEVEAHGGRAYALRDGKITRIVMFQSFADAKEFVDAQP
jgi:ketosteroid isomerase-like protein